MKAITGIVLSLIVSGAAFAGPQQSQTATWLELQRSGQVASRVSVQPANEIEREKAVDRFLKTYSNSIPANFYGNSFTTGG